ncbi:MAG: N-acetylmuramoyl-L-alanine amidase [Luteimonas sp.]
MSPNIAQPALHVDLLPYEARLEARNAGQIDLVVIHCTELPDLAMARQFGEEIRYPQSRTGNSGHYYIDRDGAIHQYVCIDRIAHHTHGYNARSIGIELVNIGRYPDWLDSRRQAMHESYTDAQLIALVALLHDLQQAVPNMKWIAGHEDLDTADVPATDDPERTVRRKRDPGPLFPWTRILGAVDLRRMKQ